MKGKIVLITGGTNGIGLETARALAMLGAKVVIVGRSATKTADVVKTLKSETQNDHIDSLLGDLSLLTGMRSVAESFRERYDRLDVLVNNAGAFFNDRQMTAEGYEMTFALNHLSYFMITNMLLDLIVDSSPARIISVSSSAHQTGVLDFDNLQGEKRYTGFQIYGQSKLMNILFSNELAHRLNGTGVTSNALHPGLVATGFGKNNAGLMRTAISILHLFAKRSTEGAATSIYAASAPELADVTGKYLVDSKVVAPRPAALNQDHQRRLWDISAEITGVGAAIKA